MNHFELTACIAEANPLRYTPAGIPASNFVLEHESEIVEGGVKRQVKLTLRAVAFGSLAEQTGQIPLGIHFWFNGFLTNARTSKSVVFHVQAIAATTPASTSALTPAP